MPIGQNDRERTVEQTRAANAALPASGSSPRVTENLSDMLVRNPAPDASPSREPTGIYRIIPANR